MADVESSLPPGGVRITNDVDGAAVGQQIAELRPIGQFVDARQIDKQEPPRIVRRGIQLIEIKAVSLRRPKMNRKRSGLMLHLVSGKRTQVALHHPPRYGLLLCSDRDAGPAFVA